MILICAMSVCFIFPNARFLFHEGLLSAALRMFFRHEFHTQSTRPLCSGKCHNCRQYALFVSVYILVKKSVWGFTPYRLFYNEKYTSIKLAIHNRKQFFAKGLS